MAAIDKIYRAITCADKDLRFGVPAPAMMLVTVIYLVAVLSVPVQAPQQLIWLTAYPIICAEITGIGFGSIFVKSLWILPVVGFIGMFNPIVDTTPAFTVGGITVSRGWVSLISIILRGLLSMQAVLILVRSIGMLDVFNAMRRFGCPSVLTSQMLLTYRYISVILEEAITMRHARAARGYGRKSYPLRMWGAFVGQLLLRSLHRAGQIHNAMKARGFDGTLPTGSDMRWRASGWIWLACWTVAIGILRFIDFSSLVSRLIQ